MIDSRQTRRRQPLSLPRRLPPPSRLHLCLSPSFLFSPTFEVSKRYRVLRLRPGAVSPSRCATTEEGEEKAARGCGGGEGRTRGREEVEGVRECEGEEEGEARWGGIRWEGGQTWLRW